MSVFADAGIQFSVITPDRTDEVCQLLGENFLPDEPISRSIGLKQNSFLDSFWSDVIKGGSCVMATDSSGKIIGVRLSEIKDKDSWFKKCLDRSIMGFLPSLAGIAKLLRKPVLQKTCEVVPALLGKLKYDIWPLFDEFGCQKILSAVCVCTATESRVKGLGTELVKQSESLGREKGCDYSVVLVTGLYSGKIFREKCNYTVRSETLYAKFLDKDGNLYLDDTREHLSSFMCHKNISG